MVADPEEGARAFVDSLEKVFRLALREGGPNAKMSVSDILRVIEAFQNGKLAGDAPITGPFYPPGVQ